MVAVRIGNVPRRFDEEVKAIVLSDPLLITFNNTSNVLRELRRARLGFPARIA
jgi:hypothetical protein